MKRFLTQSPAEYWISFIAGLLVLIYNANSFVITGCLNFAAGWLLLSLYRMKKSAETIIKLSIEDETKIITLLDPICKKLGIKRPDIYAIKDPADMEVACVYQNCFGIRRLEINKTLLLVDDIIEAVLAHEMAHLRHRDTLWQPIFLLIMVGIVLECMQAFPDSYIFACSTYIIFYLVFNQLKRFAEFKANRVAARTIGIEKMLYVFENGKNDKEPWFNFLIKNVTSKQQYQNLLQYSKG